jgi:hypothetical protein
MILPVNADVVSSNVSDFDHKGISISHFQGWPWELSIYCNGVVGSAQPLHWFCLNLYQSKEDKGKSLITLLCDLVDIQDYIPFRNTYNDNKFMK